MTLILIIVSFANTVSFPSRSRGSKLWIAISIASLSLALVTFGSSVNYAEYGSSAAAKRARVSVRDPVVVRHHTLYMARVCYGAPDTAHAIF